MLVKTIMKLICKQVTKESPTGPTCKIPANNAIKYNPFFIVGSGRSGNTLLRRILNSHNELYIPPETYVLGEVIKKYHNSPFLHWDELVEQTLSTFENAPDFKTFKINNLSQLKIKLKNVNREKRTFSLIINSFYEHYKKNHNITGNIWGDKTPLNVFCLDELSSIFPDAKFIHIIRDPFDSISSYIESGLIPNIDDASKRWVRSVDLSYQFGLKNPDKYIEVYYSALVTNPIKVSVALCEFLEIDFQESMLDTNDSDLGDVNMYKHHLNVTKKINTKSLGNGLKKLSEDEKKIILKIISISKNPIIIRLLNKHLKRISQQLPLDHYIDLKNLQIKNLDDQLKNIKDSYSFKAGRLITLPLRFILDGKKNINSIKYNTELLFNKDKRELKDKGVIFIDKRKIIKESKHLKPLLSINNDKSPKLIVSLTSFPERIPDIFFNLYSLLNQTTQADMLILWLAEEQFPNKEKDLPKNILNLKHYGLTIKWCKDLKSYKKLVFTLKEFPNDIIVTADDDIFYPENWLELLYRSYQDNPQYIHCHRAHQITFDNKGGLNSYNDWPKCINSINASYLNFCTTGGGVLYPPKSLYKDVLNEELFMILSPTADDIWFWAMAVLNHTKIKVVNNNLIDLVYIDPILAFQLNDGTTLYKINLTRNDIQLNEVINAYQDIKTSLTHHSLPT